MKWLRCFVPTQDIDIDRYRNSEHPTVTVQAKSRFNKPTNFKIETKYQIKTGQLFSCKCKKTWEDFEILYDSLELRYGESMQDVPFPKYATRRNFTKAEAVEENRLGLEKLLQNLVRHVELRNDPDLHSFLLLTAPIDSVRASAQSQDQSVACDPREHLRGRAGPTPFSIAAGPPIGSGKMDDADSYDSDTPPVASSTKSAGGGNGAKTDAKAAMQKSALAEPRGTVWLGESDFPAP